jgi:Zn-dependent protease with chaperone function
LALPVLADSSVDNLWGGTTAKQEIVTNSGLPTGGGTTSDLRTVVVQVIKFVLSFLGIVAVVIILYAGFKWMFSGGSEDKVGEAKKMLIAGLIGLVIILLAYTLADFVITQIYNAANGQPVG